jgi:cold shock CspA family protein
VENTEEITTLNEGDRVEFEIGRETKGPQAANEWRLDWGVEGRESRRA